MCNLEGEKTEEPVYVGSGWEDVHLNADYEHTQSHKLSRI